MTPIEKAAYDIGAKGSEPREDERLAFEAWMRGHCWKVVGDWDGKQYFHAQESTGFVHGGAMGTRGLWAAWRDRGAVARVLAEQAQAVEPVAWIERDMQCDDFDPDSVTCATPVGTAEGWEWVPLYLQPAPPPAADHIADAGKMVGERAKVGDSQFESWYSELHQAGKGSKQIAREAYEAGLNEAQQVAVPESMVVSTAPSYEFANGWNAYRSAMLTAQGAKLVTKKDHKPDWSAA